MAQNTSIVLHTGKRTLDEVQIRRAKIVEIKDRLMTDLGHAHQEDIIEELKKFHGISITRKTLYEDLKAINRLNTFVLDLSKENYSAMVEECYNTYLEIKSKAALIEGQKWKILKKTRTVEEQPEGDPLVTTQDQTIENDIRPNLQALTIKLNVTNAMMNLLKGNAVDTSVAMIYKEYSKMQLQKQELEEKVERLENEKILRLAAPKPPDTKVVNPSSTAGWE